MWFLNWNLFSIFYSGWIVCALSKLCLNEFSNTLSRLDLGIYSDFAESLMYFLEIDLAKLALILFTVHVPLHVGCLTIAWLVWIVSN